MERRAKNKATGIALEQLKAVAKNNHDVLNTLDTDWAKQIVWLMDTRVAAGTPSMLLPHAAHRVITAHPRDEHGDTFSFSYNVTALSELLKLPAGEVEVQLHTR